MEKKHKSFAVGMKRQRKTSLRVAASEPKSLKLSDISAIELDNLPSVKTQMDTDVAKNVIPKLTKLDASSIPSKQKSSNATENIENNDIAQPEAKKSKKRKRHSENLPAKDSAVDIHIKKKKKEKELMAELQNLKVELGIVGAPIPEDAEKTPEKEGKGKHKTPTAKLVKQDTNTEEVVDKFTILKDKELIERFLKVPMTNNQKGRIRQAVRLSLQGSTTTMFPDIINGKIQAILSSSTDLTDSELRRIRILYNMLKTALETPQEFEDGTKVAKKKKEKKKKEKADGDEKKETEKQKVKGPKRYVVFLGNLPLGITKEKIMEHFRELNEHIVDIRLPQGPADNKSAIAYVELSNEPSYELALSKHHSMLGTKRIKVLYTTQQKSKISRAQAKGKSAKLIALQKAGKLVGSVPATKKRSNRRAIMKKAKATEAANTPAE